MQKLFILLISIVVLCFVLRLSIGFFSSNRVAIGLTKDDAGVSTLDGCSDLLNCTSSTAMGKRNQVDALEYDSDGKEVIDKIATIIKSHSGTTIVEQTQSYVHASYKTLLLGYTDDLEILLDETSGALHIRSASRIGRSDLGANRKRIDALRALLKGKI